jgi:hypothetical protein
MIQPKIQVKQHCTAVTVLSGPVCNWQRKAGVHSNPFLPGTRWVTCLDQALRTLPSSVSPVVPGNVSGALLSYSFLAGFNNLSWSNEAIMLFTNNKPYLESEKKKKVWVMAWKWTPIVLWGAGAEPLPVCKQDIFTSMLSKSTGSSNLPPTRSPLPLLPFFSVLSFYLSVLWIAFVSPSFLARCSTLAVQNHVFILVNRICCWAGHRLWLLWSDLSLHADFPVPPPTNPSDFSSLSSSYAKGHWHLGLEQVNEVNLAYIGGKAYNKVLFLRSSSETLTKSLRVTEDRHPQYIDKKPNVNRQ